MIEHPHLVTAVLVVKLLARIVAAIMITVGF